MDISSEKKLPYIKSSEDLTWNFFCV